MAKSTSSVIDRSTQISRVGIVGGGQLAWMMAKGAETLSLDLTVQTPSADDPACAIAHSVCLGAVKDAAVTAEMAQRCDVITFENEFIDLSALRELEKRGVTFYPQLDCLAPLLDKYDQRQYCESIGLPSLPFATLEGEEDISDLKEVVETIGLPLVLKTRRHGYDGQGTFVLRSAQAVENTWKELGYQPVLLEAFVDFDRELAVMVARSQAGDIAVYPVVETVQIDQVCRRVIAPARVADKVAADVTAIATTLMDKLGVVGIFGIELFLTKAGQVLINEIAPRTHNSGHYTLDACETSQFEQQLRAVSDRPLGSTALTVPNAVMVNLLGTEIGTENLDSDYAQERYAQERYAQKRETIAQIPNAHVYWYGKKRSRLGRKIGHVTVLLNNSEDSIDSLIRQVEQIWYDS